MSGNAGNRQDSRQRGNAAQLLEKYKNLARDSQLAGDRVQTEYYLQYADHYFRVLEDNRSRFEDQNPRVRRRDDEDEDDGEELMEAEAGENDSDGEGDEDERPQRRRGRERQDRGDRPDREERPERGNRRDQANGHSNRESADEPETIAMDALPPAIAADSDGNEGDPENKPRRRRLKPRAGGDGDEASAA